MHTSRECSLHRTQYESCFLEFRAVLQHCSTADCSLCDSPVLWQSLTFTLLIPFSVTSCVFFLSPWPSMFLPVQKLPSFNTQPQSTFFSHHWIFLGGRGGSEVFYICNLGHALPIYYISFCLSQQCSISIFWHIGLGLRHCIACVKVKQVRLRNFPWIIYKAFLL